MLIDKVSYTNPIKNINPGVKFILSMTTLVFLLYTGSKVVFIFNFILFNLLLLFVVKVKIGDLLKLNFIPALFIYSYIFLFFENKEKLHNAQEVRLGYSSFKNGMKSFPMLVVAILKKTYYYNLNSIKAVESRMGKEFIFSHRKYKKIGFEIIFVIIIVIINLYLVVKYNA